MILEKICAMENLQEAWKRVRINKPGPGIDRVRWEDFEKNLSFNLNAIREKLQKEHYTPLPVMVFKKPNSKGTHRTIGISSIKDKVVQQAIAIVLGTQFNGIFLPCCYAYRNNLSAQTAANKAGQCIKAGNLWHLKMDVENFFDSIDHSILLGMIENEINEKPVVRLISKLLKTRIFKEMGLFDNLTGSQQGSGLSPLLSNIYLSFRKIVCVNFDQLAQKLLFSIIIQLLHTVNTDTKFYFETLSMMDRLFPVFENDKQ